MYDIRWCLWYFYDNKLPYYRHSLHEEVMAFGLNDTNKPKCESSITSYIIYKLRDSEQNDTRIYISAYFFNSDVL